MQQTKKLKGGRQLPKNVASVAAVQAESKRVQYSIKGAPGLRLVVHPTGRKVWVGVVLVKDTGGSIRRTMMELGQFHEKLMPPNKAWDDLRALQIKTKSGELEAEKAAAKEAEATADTFDDIFSAWLEGHAKVKLATWKDEEKRYEMHLKPTIGATRFIDIERKDIREIRDNVSDGAGPIQSNRVVALFNRVANWAVDEDRVKFNPAARLKKTGEERRRERILSPDECKTIWADLNRELIVDRKTDDHKAAGGLTEADLAAAIAVRRALKLVLITGQRRGEVIGMHRDELDLTKGDAWWNLPGKRTKNGLPHRVPLTDMAVAVITEALEAAGKSKFVFPSDAGDTSVRADAVTKALQRICKRLKIEGVGPHDMRRTVGTTLRKLGVSVEDRSHVFNHVSGAKSKVTSWNYDAGEHDTEKRRALEIWERELRLIVGLDERPNNVKSLRPTG